MATSATFAFGPEDLLQQHLITIIDDSVVENPEMFVLLLSSIDPFAVISDPNATVLILDDNVNDSKFITCNKQKGTQMEFLLGWGDIFVPVHT